MNAAAMILPSFVLPYPPPPAPPPPSRTARRPNADQPSFRASFGGCHLNAAARVGDQHARLRFLELQPAGNRREFSAEQAPGHAAYAAGIVLGKDDGRRHDEIGSHHLPATEVRALPGLASRGKLSLLHQVLHPGAALDDDEAVRLLNHQADQSNWAMTGVPHQRRKDLALWLNNSHRAHRLVTVLEAVVADAAVGPGRTLDDAASLALLRLG